MEAQGTAQTEARAIAERLTDYGLTLDPNVVICDRRVVDEAATALAAKDAELAAARIEADRYLRQMKVNAAARIDAEAQLAEARKALGMMLREHDILSGNFGDVMNPKHRRPDRWPTAAEAARRALTGGTNEARE